MNYIVLGKTTYQTSEDTWERATYTFIADESIKISDIMEWASKHNIDTNTIQLLPDSK